MSDHELMSSSELLQAHTLLWHCSLNYMKSMSLKCAVELGIPDAIHNHGQPIPFSKLVSSLHIHPSKAHFLYRVMRILVHYGFFTAKKVNIDQPQEEKEEEEEEEEAYSLTNPSRLLLTRDEPQVLPNMKSFVLFFLLPPVVGAWHSWSTWFQSEDNKITMFDATTEGKTFWDFTSREPMVNYIFNDTMANDSMLIAKITLEECREVFEGLKSLVDLACGTGTMANAIAKAFPHIKCTAIDLPHVVAHMEGTSPENLNFIGGDMFTDPIPSADAILLKNILHDWNDETCVTILKRCKEAVSSNGKEGKVIVIDTVLGNQITNRDLTELQLLSDVFFMGVSAKERTLMEWEKLFHAAGFGRYKIIHTFGVRSIMEAYP